MARSDMFLKVVAKRSGEIAGESNDKAFTNQIDVVDWSWGMSSPSDAYSGQAKGRRVLRELKVVKRVDRASAALMAALSTNDGLTVTLSVRKAGGTALPYFIVKLKNARLVDITVQSDVGPTGAPQLTESLAFAYTAIDVDYTPQLAAGSGGGATSWSDDISASS